MRQTAVHGGTRYHQLETVREYAAASDLPLTDDERTLLDAGWANNFGVTNRYEMPLKSSA